MVLGIRITQIITDDSHMTWDTCIMNEKMTLFSYLSFCILYDLFDLYTIAMYKSAKVYFFLNRRNVNLLRNFNETMRMKYSKY